MDLTSKTKPELIDLAVNFGLYATKTAARTVKISELRDQLAKVMAEDVADEASMGDDIATDEIAHVDSPECECVACGAMRLAVARTEARIGQLLDKAKSTRGVPFARQKRLQALKTARKLARTFPKDHDIHARIVAVRTALAA